VLATGVRAQQTEGSVPQPSTVITMQNWEIGQEREHRASH